MTTRTLKFIAAVSLFVLVGGVAALAVSTSGTDAPPSLTVTATTSSGDTDTQTPPPPASRFDPELQATFQVLQRPAEQHGAPVSPWMAGRGANPDLSRPARTSDGRTLYLVPTRDGICLDDAGAVNCGPVAAAISGQISVLSACGANVPSGSMRLSGLVPDGTRTIHITTSTGVVIAREVNDNVYTADLPAAPSAIDWSDNTGSHHLDIPTLPMPDATDCVQR